MPHDPLPMWQYASGRIRFALMIATGTVAAVVTGLSGSWPYAGLVGWDCAAFVFSAWTWALLVRMDETATATHATREEPGRTQGDAIILLASIASLVAVGFVLIQASHAKGSDQDLLAALGLLSVALSWCAIQCLFALRYARLYYGDPPGGIDFNQDHPAPRYLDFAYLAFTVGMTYQVSDTELKTPSIRATVLRQALLAYLFGAVILGASINLIAGLANN